MKLVTWTDAAGWEHRSAIRDDDPPRLAHEGLLQDPPSINAIDWDEVKRTLHNQLVSRGLFTRADIQRDQQGVAGAVLAALRKTVIELYT